VRKLFALLLSVAFASCSTSSQGQANTAASAAPEPTIGITTYGATLPAGPELTVLRTDCEICHSGDMYATQRLSKTVWDAEVAKMIGFGAPISESQRVALVNYLSRYLGTTARRDKVVPVVTAPPITFTGP
jgi:cytochrome c5